MEMWLNWHRARAGACVWMKVVLSAVALCGIAERAAGQCGEWGILGSSSVRVGAAGGKLVVWDRDGDGPEAALLVTCATGQVGDLITSLAGWNGTQWLDLRPELVTQPNPLCTLGNDLLCVKSYPREIIRVHADRSYTVVTDIGMNSQVLDAMSDGQAAYVLGQTPNGTSLSWWIHRLEGTGWVELPMSFRLAGVDARPSQLLMWNGGLVVVGAFDEVGGHPADRIALWDGDSWEAFAPFPDHSAWLTAGVFDQSLFATADRYPRRWSGSAWEVPAQEAFPRGQFSLGMTTNVVYSATGVYVPLFATRFDGVTWVPFNSRLMQMPLQSADWRGTPVVSAGSRIALIEDSVTHPLTDGLFAPPSVLGEWNGDLVAAGVEGAGTRVATPVVRWDGSDWQDVGQNFNEVFGWSDVTSIKQWGDRLLVGRRTTGGDQTFRGLYSYDGADWALEQPLFWNSVLAIDVWNDQPIVLGTVAGVRRLARWDGAQWQELVPSADAAAMLQIAVAGPRLIVAGSFTQIAGVAANRIAAWDGQSWSALGVGSPNSVSHLGVYRQQPVVGSGQDCAWWNGTDWVQVPFGHWDSYSYFVEYHGDLIKGNTWTERWSPEQGLRTISLDEIDVEGTVRLAAVAGDTLFLAGDIYRTGGVPAAYCVAWNDSPTCDCDSIDFNRDGVFPDIADIPDFLNVFQGGFCAGQPASSEYPCNGDLDFNNDGLSPDTLDIQAFLSVFSGGPCLQ